jgi:hypothetical protein
MAKQLSERNTLLRLLGVKRGLDAARGPPQPAATADRSTHAQLAQLIQDVADPEPEDPAGTLCINCGYNQQGVHLARCPECGLPLAAHYRDPARWAATRASPSAWWTTALDVWTYQRRLRVRASLMPVTPQARRFGRWSIVVTAVILSLTLALADLITPGKSGVAALRFAVRLVSGTVLIGPFLHVALFCLARSLKSTWRGHYPFIPGSVYYATAWWPPIASLFLVTTALYARFPVTDVLVLMAFMGLLGFFQWGFWLWSSLDAAERVAVPALRIGAVVLVAGIAGSSLMSLVSGASQWTLGQVLGPRGGLSKVQLLGSVRAGTLSTAPQTYALIIDMFAGDDEKLVPQMAARLGASPATQVFMRGSDATLENIRRTLNTFRSELKPDDRLLLYIGGHGEAQGAGAIHVTDGFVTSQMLADFVSDLPTPRTLVIIDSCFAGKFIRAFRLRQTNAAVITATDQDNVSFRQLLTPFWKAWQKSESDQDHDGRVTVAEAFTAAYRQMLQIGEQDREHAILYHPDARDLMNKSGYSTPQYDVLGQAKDDEFFIPIPVGGAPNAKTQ